MNAIDILLIVAGVGYILARRVIGDIVQVKSLLVLPAVLTVVGLFQLRNVHHVDPTVVAFVGAGLLVSVAIGLVRGATVHLGTRGTELWMRYRASTVALWVLNIGIRGAMIPLEYAVSKDAASSAGSTILLSVGVGILAESLVVLYRAMRREGTVVWEKGGEGEAHTPSPAFDRARDRMHTGEGLRDVVSVVKRDW